MRPALFPSRFRVLRMAQYIVLLNVPRGSMSFVFNAILGLENSPLCPCCSRRTPKISTPRNEPASKQEAELATNDPWVFSYFFWGTHVEQSRVA